MGFKEKLTGDYFVGLDVGTGSIGWAITDTNYNLLTFNGKSTWGSHMFDAAETAATRRVHRTSRRRLERRKARLKLLASLFAEEVAKVDPEFFLRLESSQLFEEDKSVAGKYAFFNDPNYSDVAYNEQYPTIYHLRHALMTNEEAHDVRLVYMAIHHIIKHRGHFLLPGTIMEQALDPTVLIEQFKSAVADYLNMNLYTADSFVDTLKAKLPITDKKKLLAEQMELTDLEGSFDSKALKDQRVLLGGLLAGGNTNLSKLFQENELASTEAEKIDLSKDITEKEGVYMEELGDRYELIACAKALYDWALLQRLLNGKRSISAAKIEGYNQHAEDLKALKDIVNTDYPAQHLAIFGPAGKGVPNYSAYVGKVSGRYHPKRKKKDKTGVGSGVDKNCTQEEFLDFLRKTLGIKSSKENQAAFEAKYPEVYRRIVDGDFLPLQKTKDNSTIPYQVHALELSKILDHASQYLPFLNEVDDEGYKTCDKIMSLLTFRIPYFVGPINTYHGKYSWAVRKAAGKIYPWNFESKIDYAESATRFIERMTNKCTYLPMESVLPKNSILYSKFMVLNALNTIRVENRKLPVEVKQAIFRDLFLKQKKKVTKKSIRKYLEVNGYYEKNSITDDSITGMDNDIPINMGSYVDFAKIFYSKDPDFVELNPEEIRVAEICIKNLTLFGEDKKMLVKRLVQIGSPYLTEDAIKAIKRLKYQGWGRLSEKFLAQVTSHLLESPNAPVSIIDALYANEESPNLMQLLSNDYGYAKKIEEMNREQIEDKSLQGMLDDLYVSPAVRRSIYKSIAVMKEIVKIAGKAPGKIFIEMARENETNKKRTKSRKDRVKELYDAIKKEARDGAFDDLDMLGASLDDKTDFEMRGDKLFLYYMQLGRCVYSGEKIDLGELDRGYDIDHIYPRCYVKDDSLNNRVLVKKQLNAKKTDIYPVPDEIRGNTSVQRLWRMLLHLGFMSKEKYDRLTRATGFTTGELEGFVNRQLVETRQSTKALAQVLHQQYPDSKIVYVKAGNVSDFRHGIMDYGVDEETKICLTGEVRKSRERENRMLKFRTANDMHHGKDAYLNIVVGNVYHTRFTDNPRNFIEKAAESPKRMYSLNAMYRLRVKNAWIPSTIDKDGTVTEGTMATVRKYMKRNNVLVTTTAYEKTGKLFDENLKRKGEATGGVPQKAKGPLANMEKYGGYGSVKIAYFYIVEHGSEKKRIRTIESMPILYANQIRNTEDLLAYCTEAEHLVDPVILVPKVRVGELFLQDGFKFTLSGKSDKRVIIRNANQLILDEDYANYLKTAEKECARVKDKLQSRINPRSGISKEKNIEVFDYLLDKMTKKPYNVYYKVVSRKESRYATMLGHRDAFLTVGEYEQIQVLLEILRLFNRDASDTNLKLIGGVEHFGKLMLSKNITKLKDLSILYPSVTGLFENRRSIS